MIYELRTYECHPGKLNALHRRFADWGLKFFARHQIEAVGFWTDPLERLVYLVRFPDQAAKERAWAGLAADAEWQKVKAESETEGPLVARIESTILQPVPYSPLLT